MSTIALDQAQRQLPELIRALLTEGEILILDQNVPVAKLSAFSTVTPPHSMRDHQPSSVGALLQPYPAPDEDLLAERLPASR